ncbi:tetracycline resistance protein from transposon [Xylariales sp. PMI_506]|nr:tetracycline resistance protein from transposon [Xylariales sp. PMI_506]
MTTPKIAIIGAGPVGCTLARILHVNGVATTVFESDSSPNYRSQGGSLDLHPKTGIAALKDAQLFDDFKRLARYEGDYYLMSDKHLKPLLTWGPSPGGNQERPEIDRGDLRQMLAESLPEGTIQWGKRLERVDDPGTLVFKDGTTALGFDLIVGAEGAWSKVRNILTDIKPYFSGITHTLLEIREPAKTAPELKKLVRGGNVFAHSEGIQLSIQYMGDESLYISYDKVGPEDWVQTCGYDANDLEQRRAAILEDLTDWDPRLTEAVEKADGQCQSKSLYMLPIGFRWDHKPGVTIIGDAAHLMTPFAGEGVNVGMADARGLAAAIVRAVKGVGKKSLDAEMKIFEEEMFVRMERYQDLTRINMEKWFKTPEEKLPSIIPDIMMSHVKMESPRAMIPLAWVGVHGWWWFKSVFSS